MGDKQRYEHKSVKAVRGADRIVIAKWEKRGWELVDQTPGAVRTELNFRRSNSRLEQPFVVAGLVAVLAVVITIGVVIERTDDSARPSVSPKPSSVTPGKIVKDGSYAAEDLLTAVARLGFACPSPTLTGTSQQAAPKFIHRCANNRTVIILGDTLGGADPAEVFILGLDSEAEFADGPWLVGPNWALNGPGVEKVYPALGGTLLRHPTREALEFAR